MRWSHLRHLVVVPLLVAGLPGQLTFRTQSRVVPIYASVRGVDGRLATGLTKDDFLIFDNGQQRPVSLFSTESVPLSVVALLQVGHRPDSVVSQRSEPTRAAGAALVASLGELDVLQIGSYGSEAVINPIATGDRATLTRILDEEIWARRSGAALLNALDKAHTQLTTTRSRRVIVVVGDGVNTDFTVRLPSRFGAFGAWQPPVSWSNVRDRALRDDTMIYALSIDGSGLGSDLRDLAFETGGGARMVAAGEDLPMVVREVLNELHHQYILGFEPTAVDDLQHRLEVRVTRPGATVRARRSYIAASRGIVQ